MASRLLIDGYNLLFASDVFASNAGPPTFERTRSTFLDVLATVLPERQRGRTTIVFDAAQAPLGLPHAFQLAEMQIYFSRRPQHADDLLEEILFTTKTPREWLVVSSDHRVQRAARQRGAEYIDSEVWWQELKRPVVVAEKTPPRESLNYNPFPPGYGEDLLPKQP
jgi:predicted RNA-binding protein with PIN domain